MLNTLLERVAVVGAAGKMGRGISLLLLQEMARLEAKNAGKVGSGRFRLTLFDIQDALLDTMPTYLKANIQKWAEKNINELRISYANDASLVDNSEIIAAFVEGAMNMVHLTPDITRVQGARLVFEAVPEDLDLKINTFKALKELEGKDPVYYFSNTSSMPIKVLNDATGLRQHLVGFHFYNPPPVQRLVELITNGATEEITGIAVELGNRLGKLLVTSNDVAGFIGNGHFLREISFACEQVEGLTSQHKQETAICLIDTVTREFLVRPMGIFQLLDYVGLDVGQKICNIMTRYIPNLTLHWELVSRFVAAGIVGGQKGDGSQKDGIFRYEKGVPQAIYNLTTNAYEPLPNIDDPLGKLPEGLVAWKNIVKNPQKGSLLNAYFRELFEDKTLGARLAQAFLKQSREIAQDLLKNGVAESSEDINTVLKNGFAHVYGPINTFF